jgi:hypothetical protein
MEALKRYLEDEGLSCTAFAERLKVEDSTVWRWVHGTGDQRRRPSLRLALGIERLTGGRVPVSSWTACGEGSVRSTPKRKAPRGRRVA